jgi:heme-degrading monooxygenase HmoA
MTLTHRNWNAAIGAALVGSLLLFAFAIAGCDGDGASGGDAGTDPCSRGAVESDLQSLPWQGPGVDPSGNLEPGQYLISTTYLRLKPNVNPEFMELFGPIMGRLQMQKGLVAVRVAQSSGCGSARTLGVWADEASMYDFVASPEHSAAVAKIGDLNRGGSAVVHFAGDASSATFENGAAKLAAVSSF